VTATQLTTLALLHPCNNNVTLKMSAIPAEIYWWEYSE